MPAFPLISPPTWASAPRRRISSKVGWLERELEKWVVATDFDYKS